MDIPGLFGITTTTIDSVLIPTKVKSVKSRIMDIAMGPNHTVCLTGDSFSNALLIIATQRLNLFMWSM